MNENRKIQCKIHGKCVWHTGISSLKWSVISSNGCQRWFVFRLYTFVLSNRFVWNVLCCTRTEFYAHLWYLYAPSIMDTLFVCVCVRLCAACLWKSLSRVLNANYISVDAKTKKPNTNVHAHGVCAKNNIIMPPLRARDAIIGLWAESNSWPQWKQNKKVMGQLLCK